MAKILFLVSGGDGNMKFIHLAKKYNLISFEKLGVIADRDCKALAFAKSEGLYNKLVSYSIDDPRNLIEAINDFSPDIIITNWHKILGEDVVSLYQGKLINLHYSLLPAYSGLIGIKPIQKAMERGCKYIGPTCHIVDEGVDTGKIISQTIFKTPNSLDLAVETMFRYGCITLLDGINQTTNYKMSNKDFSTNNIEDNLKIFNSEFWMELSTL